MAADFPARAFLPRLLILAVLCFAAIPARAAPEARGAIEVVETFHAALLEIMKKAPSMKIKARYRRLSTEIERSFDIAFMAKVIAGSSWKRTTETQRASLAAAFKRMSAAVYAARFNSFSGQSFRTLKTRPGPRQTLLVVTNLIRPKNKPVELVYVMKKQKAGWRIIDVILAGGISELALRYSESRQILRQKGMGGLVASLEAMARRMVGSE